MSKDEFREPMKTILFVCTANIARSPMAEALFNEKLKALKLVDRYRACSAGTWARNGRPAAQFGQRVMWARGLDIRHHRSRLITSEMVADVDLILTMEIGQKEALRFEFPEKKDKIFTLAELTGHAYDIPDPFGQGQQAFETTARELEELINKGMEKIIALASQEAGNTGDGT